MGQTPRGRSFSPTQLPRWLLLAIAFVVVFVAGLCVSYTRAERLDSQLETTSRALTLARLETALATAALEARRGRYESARQLASEFFSGLQRASAEMPAEARGAARAILAQRDTTITLLSRSAQTSTDLLDALLGQFSGVEDAAVGR